MPPKSGAGTRTQRSTTGRGGRQGASTNADSGRGGPGTAGNGPGSSSGSASANNNPSSSLQSSGSYYPGLYEYPAIRINPLDFETLPLSSLRKYITTNKLNVPSPKTPAGFMLEGSVGKKTLSSKHNMRLAKSEVASEVKRHFLNQPVRDTDVIVDFIYSAKRQDKAFKMQF